MPLPAAADTSLPGFDELFEEAACGLVLCDSKWTIRRVNKTLCRWVERGPDALVGQRKVQELLSIGGQIFFQTHLSPLLHIQGSVAEVKLDIVKADNGTLPVVLNAVAKQHADHSYWQLALFVAQDRHQYELELLKARQRAEVLLEQERKALDALARAQEALEQQRALAEDRAKLAELLVGVVSHDLRNPLSVIRTSAHILGMGDQSDRQRQTLQRIHSATNRAVRMIADLLDLTQVRLGNGLLVKLAPMNLHDVVGDAVLELRLAFQDREIVHDRSGDGECQGDSDRLAQLVGNLVANAVSYGAPSEPVTVVSETTASSCAVSVHNRGDPIPSELLPKVFEPLRRGDVAGGGAHSIGLGLFIVQAIARAHGGDARIASSAADGTCFRVSWPV